MVGGWAAVAWLLNTAGKRLPGISHQHWLVLWVQLCGGGQPPAGNKGVPRCWHTMDWLWASHQQSSSKSKPACTVIVPKQKKKKNKTKLNRQNPQKAAVSLVRDTSCMVSQTACPEKEGAAPPPAPNCPRKPQPGSHSLQYSWSQGGWQDRQPGRGGGDKRQRPPQNKTKQNRIKPPKMIWENEPSPKTVTTHFLSHSLLHHMPALISNFIKF